MTKTCQKGRSMVEMLGVLAIVGVLSVGGIMAYNMAMTKFKTTKQVDQIQLLMTNIKTLFASQPNYDGLNNGVLVNLGYLTSNVDAKGAAAANQPVDNAFGGTLVVASNAAAYTGQLGQAVANGSYTITIDRIPRSACANIANTDWGDADSGLLDFQIGGGNSLNVYTNAAGSRTKATIAAITAACGAPNATMVWVVK